MSFGDFDVNKRPANNNNNRRGVGSSSSSSQPAAFESNIQKGGFGDKVTTGMATATAAKSSTLSAAQNGKAKTLYGSSFRPPLLIMLFFALVL